MSEERFRLSDWCGEQNVSNVIDIEKQTHLTNIEVLDLLHEQQFTIEQLKKLVARIEEEKEYYANLYNECHRLKLSDEAIKQAYADLNRREREKHSQGDATYTAKMNWNEVIY